MDDTRPWRNTLRRRPPEPPPLEARLAVLRHRIQTRQTLDLRAKSTRPELLALVEALEAAAHLLDLKRALAGHPGCVEYESREDADSALFVLMRSHDEADEFWEEAKAELLRQ